MYVRVCCNAELTSCFVVSPLTTLHLFTHSGKEARSDILPAPIHSPPTSALSVDWMWVDTAVMNCSLPLSLRIRCLFICSVCFASL